PPPTTLFPYTTLFRSRDVTPDGRPPHLVRIAFPGIGERLATARDGVEFPDFSTGLRVVCRHLPARTRVAASGTNVDAPVVIDRRDRKSTRLNSSHDQI